ncbi:MAG: hypothetical protein ABIE07_11105 [Candidatus Zixiibacteriota bacterium]
MIMDISQPRISLLLFFSIALIFNAYIIANDKPENEITMSDAQQILKQADEIFKSRKYEESRDYYLKVLDEAEKTNNLSDQTEALAMIARTYLILDDITSGYPWLEKAKKAADFDQPLGWSRFMGVKGRFLWKEEKLDEATVIFENMYDYCSERKLHDRAIDAAHMVAITGDQETQVIWAYKAINEAEAGGLESWLGPLWNNLGATLEEMERFYESLEAYLKARNYHYKHGNDFNKAIADWAVGHAYVNIGDIENASKWINPVLDKFIAMDEGEFIGFTYREMGEIELAKENFSQAHDYFVRAEEKLKEVKMPKWNPDGYQKILNRIDETQKNK